MASMLLITRNKLSCKTSLSYNNLLFRFSAYKEKLKKRLVKNTYYFAKYQALLTLLQIAKFSLLLFSFLLFHGMQSLFKLDFLPFSERWLSLESYKSSSQFCAFGSIKKKFSLNWHGWVGVGWGLLFPTKRGRLWDWEGRGFRLTMNSTKGLENGVGA